jgi:arylsulfatase A-like enzyme
MGLILDKLDELGFVDNTMLIMASDHGDSVASFGGHFDKDAFMPEEMIRIPFLIRYPGVIPPRIKLDNLVSNIDLAPTILDAAGTSFSDPIDGRSILTLFTDKEHKWREEIMCETHGHYIHHLGRAIVSDRYKYVWNENDKDELYDLEEDPFQLTNLINQDSSSKILPELKKRLSKWRTKTGDDITGNMILGRKLRR